MRSSRSVEFSPYSECIAHARVAQVLISTPIQLFIAWRVRVLTNSLILPCMIGALAIISFGESSHTSSPSITHGRNTGGGISVTTIVTLHPPFADFPQFHLEVITWLVSSAACDVLLTFSLVYSLVRAVSLGNVNDADADA